MARSASNDPAFLQAFRAVVDGRIAEGERALDALAEALASRVAPGGVIALSGILKGQDEALVERYSAWFDDLVVTQREDWVRITGRRRPD